jgi:hypothetical protein
LWQFIPAVPTPTLVLLRLSDLLVAAAVVRKSEQGDIVFLFIAKEIVRERTVSDVGNEEARFLEDLSLGTLFNGFAEFKMAAGKRPKTAPVRAFSPTEKNLIVFDHYHSYPYRWSLHFLSSFRSTAPFEHHLWSPLLP